MLPTKLILILGHYISIFFKHMNGLWDDALASSELNDVQVYHQMGVMFLLLYLSSVMTSMY